MLNLDLVFLGANGWTLALLWSASVKWKWSSNKNSDFSEFSATGLTNKSNN